MIMTDFTVPSMASEAGTIEEGITRSRDVVSVVIAGWEWRWFFGMAVPYMKFVDVVGPGAFPIMGHLLLDLDDTYRCSSCMADVRAGERFCSDCANLPINLRLSCILEGAGVPFGGECDKDAPVCGEISWARAVCYSQWMIYIAEVFGVLKVGISRKGHGGCSVGFTQRLLSQGAGQWIALGPVQGLQRAREMEDRISVELGLSQRVTARDRLGYLIAGDAPPKLPLDAIREWLIQNDLPMYMAGDFSEYHTLTAWDDYEHAEDTRSMAGRVVLSRGPMIGLDDGTVTVFDLSRLVGRAIVGDL